MIREVDLISYLPEFMQNYKEPVATLEAENPEFQIIWDASSRVLKNRFISTADEYGISRFEALLGIYPRTEDTLESRRSRVQSNWFNKIPYTWKILLQKLLVLHGDANFMLYHDFETGYTLTLDTELELYGQVEELERMLTTILPENIIINVRNIFSCNAQGDLYSTGGVCQIDEFFITQDYSMNQVIEGELNLAAGANVTVTEIITA